MTNADSLVFRVEFSEPVAGLGVDDFTASTGDVTAVEELRRRARCTVGGPEVEHGDGNVREPAGRDAGYL